MYLVNIEKIFFCVIKVQGLRLSKNVIEYDKSK